MIPIHPAASNQSDKILRLERLASMPAHMLASVANAKPHRITEYFYSIQGEGARAGHPAFFIRYSKCNFRCSWCDSARTWDNNDTQTASFLMDQLRQTNAKTVVITGGEPMLYRYREEFVAFILWLKAEGYYVEIESDAALIAPDILLDNVNQWNLSPKIGSSGIEMTDEYAKAIADWSALAWAGRNIWFKFVVRDTNDMNAVLECTERFGIAKERVFLMPEGNSIQQQMENMSYVVERCLIHGFSFSPRTHVLIWGGEEAR